MMQRRKVLGLAAAALGAAALPSLPISALAASDTTIDTRAVLLNWYRLVLALVRHTATYSPPVASRTFAYLGTAVYEAQAQANPAMTSLAGQLAGLTAPPPRPAGAVDDALLLHSTLSQAVAFFFANTGPTGQRALAAMNRQTDQALRTRLPADVADRSVACGQAVAAHIIAWAGTDGCPPIENMGFPLEYTLTEGPANWVPTSLLGQQQTPLLPNWGKNRPFAMPATGCPLPPPPAYSEDPASAFYKEAMEVVTARASLTDDQKSIARFWSDDPMLTSTPPGHWITIALDLIDRQGLDAPRAADLLARIGITTADAFIACWAAKFEYDLLRPVTYIRRVIDPKWEALLITPPFPEYPSGHSTQSGAAAMVLTAIFGENFAFTDTTNFDEGLPGRDFPSFQAAAEEAGISRLYGGIHFRAAIERGLDQGRCVGAHAIALRTL